jgi:hypothetical protein
LPTGKVFLAIFYQVDGVYQYFDLVKLDKKNWKLEHKMRSKKHFLLYGALASGLNGKIYITGSKVGKTKAAISVDTKADGMSET